MIEEQTKSSSKVYHISPLYLRNLRVEVSGGRRMRRERDNDTTKGEKDFDKSAIQYHGKTKNYKKQQPEDD